ncbi:iron-sulfur cluster assembly scaffold protein [Halomonas sp. AOP42-C1-46]|uniref:iron-sulfur cluster assembly scaffold protein n=1 Tax=unclassified Halomonas TaxID=2609666 RepID=UPI004033B6F5
MNSTHDSTDYPDFLVQLKKYAAKVRRDRRIQNSDARTITLESELESKDSVTIDVIVNDGVIQEVGYRVRACSLTQATTAVVAERAIGLDKQALSAVEQQAEVILQDNPPSAEKLIWPELMMLQEAAGMPSRHEVALLPFRALQRLLGE